MNIRNARLTLAATAALLAFNAAAEPAANEAPPTDRATAIEAAPERTVADELLASIRELLRLVTPEISLPRIEISFPTLDLE